MSIERIFVAGAGLMGHGIGQVFATIGVGVTLYEPDLARAEAGRDRIAGNLDRAVAKGKLDQAVRDAIVGRVAVTADLDEAQEADLILEAVFEDVAVKQALWHELDDRTNPDAIFASNTSSISIDQLASAVSPSTATRVTSPRRGPRWRRKRPPRPTKPAPSCCPGSTQLDGPAACGRCSASPTQRLANRWACCPAAR